MIHLDTNCVIAILNRRTEVIRQRFLMEIEAGASIAISVTVVYEMAYGYEKSAFRDRSKAAFDDFLRFPVTVLAFDNLDAEAAGELRASLERRGSLIGPYDLFIAAHARRRGATLVTANLKEFQRVPGLNVEDWSA